MASDITLVKATESHERLEAKESAGKVKHDSHRQVTSALAGHERPRESRNQRRAASTHAAAASRKHAPAVLDLPVIVAGASAATSQPAIQPSSPSIAPSATTALQVPAPAPAESTAAATETLNVQLQTGKFGSLPQLMPMITAVGATTQSTIIPGLYTVQGPTASMAQLATKLSASPLVEYAQPQKMVQTQTVPNDPDYTNGDEWQLTGTWGINPQPAWNATTGSYAVIVADTDTGMDYNLSDLYDNVWLNQPEIPDSVVPYLTHLSGDDGVFDFTDLNNSINQGSNTIEPVDGIVDGSDVLASWNGGTQDGFTATPNDLIGWNFVNGDNSPLDANGHGTFTAGEIGAVTNNSVGVAGTVWNASIMPVQFLDSSGSGTDTAAAEAIDYAVQHGAKVINASWGGSGTDSTIAAARSSTPTKTA